MLYIKINKLISVTDEKDNFFSIKDIHLSQIYNLNRENIFFLPSLENWQRDLNANSMIFSIKLR